MDIRQLRCFCLVAEKKSFTLAAQALRLSQPSVSFQIASLEEELGTRLFDRQSKETTITPSGQTLYEYARRILKLCDEAEQAVNELKGLVKGRVVIGASTIPGEYILPELLSEFRDRYPGIQVELTIGDTRGILEKVLANEVELGVVGAAQKGDRIEFLLFVSDRLVLVAPARSEWFQGGAATIEELKRAPFVMRESGSGTRTTVSQKLRQMGVGENELNIVMTLGSTTAVKRAVEGGVGISIMSERAVERELSLGSIRKVQLEGFDVNRDFLIAYRSGKTLPPAAAALLEFLKEKKGDLHRY